MSISLDERDSGRKLNAVVYDQYGQPMTSDLVNWIIVKTDVGQGYAASKTNVENPVTVFPKRTCTVDIEARYAG